MVRQILVAGPVWGKKMMSSTSIRDMMQTGSEQFTYNGCSMDTSYQLRARVIIVVVLQQELPGFLIQCRFGIRIDQQALDRHEYMANAKG